MQKKERIQLIVYISFRVFILLACALSIYNKSWLNLIICILTLLISYIPSIVEKRFKIDYPSEFEMSILFFIFASLFLGEINYFYHRFWWWDIFLHSLSGIIVTDFAFSLIYTLNQHKNISTFVSPAFSALFAFSFAMCIAALWEIFEFSMDQILGLNMQKSGLIDTMVDIIVFAITASLYAIAGYVYFKNEEKLNKLDHWLHKFFNKSKIIRS